MFKGDASRATSSRIYKWHLAFLNLVFTFDEQMMPTDFQCTAFRHATFLSLKNAKDYAINKLARSGREFRLVSTVLNLWSVEKSTSPSWSIRQTAVYHSFNVDTGRALWTNIRGNILMQERISEAPRHHIQAIGGHVTYKCQWLFRGDSSNPPSHNGMVW